MFSSTKVKNEIINALKNDGFNVIDKKDFVIATKKENILYIRGLEDIQTELNFKYLAEKTNLKEIGGISVSDIRQLLTESLNKKLTDVMSFMCAKLNWGIYLSDAFQFNGKTINLVEVATDKNEIITMVFYDENRKDKFFAVEMTARKFMKLMDSIQYAGLQNLAPTFYQLIHSHN